MSTVTYTHAENAAFLADLAGTLGRIGGQAKNIERLNDLAAREAEQDPGYVAYVNERVRAALENPGQSHTLDEARAIVRSWRSK